MCIGFVYNFYLFYLPLNGITPEGGKGVKFCLLLEPEFALKLFVLFRLVVFGFPIKILGLIL